MEKVKLGLIGCGLAAKTIHGPAMEQLKDKFVMAAVAGRTEEKARAFAETVGAEKYYTDYRKMLEDPTIEAVTITTPFEMNYEVTKAVLESGKHVLVEKPMARSLEEAAEMVKWEKATELTTMIAENFRYRRAMMGAEKHIKDGSIGTPHSLIYTCYGHIERDTMWLTDSKWRLSSVGGIMLDRDIHYIATIRMLMGDVKSAIGRAIHMRNDVDCPDTIALHMVFENGASGSLFDFASVKGISRREVIVVGSTGTVVLSEQCTKLTVVNEDGLSVEESYKDDRSYSFYNEYLDFFNGIRTGAPVRSSFAEGYKDLQLGLIALEGDERWDMLRI